MIDIEDLIRRLEQATEPDRKLDCDLARLVAEGRPKPYTASIDAALTLVPGGVHLVIDVTAGTGVVVTLSYGRPVRHHRWATLTSTPIALCVVSLKAIADIKEKEKAILQSVRRSMGPHGRRIAWPV